MRQKFRDPLAVSNGPLSSVERVGEVSSNFEDRITSKSVLPVNQVVTGCSRLVRHSSESDLEAPEKRVRRPRKSKNKDQMRSVSVDQIERSRRKRTRAGEAQDEKENRRDPLRKRRGSHDVLGSNSQLKSIGHNRQLHHNKRDGSNGAAALEDDVRLRHKEQRRKRQKNRNSREFILSDDWLKSVGSGVDMTGPITSSTNLIAEFASQQQSTEHSSQFVNGDFIVRDSDPTNNDIDDGGKGVEGCKKP